MRRDPDCTIYRLSLREDHVTDIDWDNLPPSTMPPGLDLVVKDFSNEEAARKLGSTVLQCLDTIGSFIDLTSLDGVTIAIDYDAALASVDRGIGGLRPLARSNTTEMQGVAMSPAVTRDGTVKRTSSSTLDPLFHSSPTKPNRATGRSRSESSRTNAPMFRSPPKRSGPYRPRDLERESKGMSMRSCSSSPRFVGMNMLPAGSRHCSPPGQNETHSETLLAALAGARHRSNEAIKAYRIHHDLNRLVGEAGPELCQPMRAAAYLLGGMDAVDADWADFPAVRTAAEAADYGVLIDDLHAILRGLWASQEDWSPTLDTFAPLEALAKRVFDKGGLLFHTSADGNCRIDVPFTRQTMPEI